MSTRTSHRRTAKAQRRAHIQAMPICNLCGHIVLSPDAGFYVVCQHCVESHDGRQNAVSVIEQRAAASDRARR